MLSNTYMKFNEISRVVFKKNPKYDDSRKKHKGLVLSQQEITCPGSTSTLFIHVLKMPCVFYKTS